MTEGTAARALAVVLVFYEEFSPVVRDSPRLACFASGRHSLLAPSRCRLLKGDCSANRVGCSGDQGELKALLD
jgi:hypothetical protein